MSFVQLSLSYQSPDIHYISIIFSIFSIINPVISFIYVSVIAVRPILHITSDTLAFQSFLVSPCFRFETCVISCRCYESTVNQVERASEGPNNLSFESSSIARVQI